MGWRQEQERQKKFDDVQKGIFLEEIAKHSRVGHAAQKADITPTTFREHLKDDKAFAKAYDAAREYYASHIHEEAHNQFVNGVKTQKITKSGEKFEDLQFPSNPMMQMELKRTNAEYKDKVEVDLNVKGSGVLMVPPRMTTDEWMAKYGKPAIEDGDGDV